MRVRILKMIATSLGGFNPGEVADVPKKIGQAWCAAGLACEDKSLDGASEAKAQPPKQRSKPKKRVK